MCTAGVEVGTSAAAGRQALALTAITRVLVPVPALLLPSLIMLRLSRLPAFQNNRVLKTTAEIRYQFSQLFRRPLHSSN
jgi:hypothetical protein